MRKVLTLCLVIKEDSILLGMKKRGYGEGCWNGFGGKIESGEAITAAAVRELREEAGIETGKLHPAGKLEFSYTHSPEVLEVHVFRVLDFSGEPLESEEMRPEWFHKNKIPFEQMWPDDKYWFPYVFEEKLFNGKFVFDKPANLSHAPVIVSSELYEVKSL